MSQIVIIGAGITGVTTAYALIQAGHQVTILDRNRYPAMETSFANGGQLSASNAEVWNSTSTVLKGLKWMWKRDAPLLMRLSPSWHKYSWLGEFLWNIQYHGSNTVATTRMAIEARRHLFAIAERESISFDLEKRGILHIYDDRSSFEAAERVNTLLRLGGLDRRAVTPEELRTIEPTLHGQYYGGFFTESDSTGDIHKFTRGLAEACKRRGATFRQEADVVGIDALGGTVRVTWNSCDVGTNAKKTDSLEADKVVVCAGAASRHFASMLGDRVNVYPVKGYSITVHLESSESKEAAPYVSLLDDAAKIVTSRLGSDRFRVAGTAEFTGFNRDIRIDRIEPLVAWVRAKFPGIDTSRVVPWAGLRPMMPNMMPIVRRGRKAGVFYNTGHGHLGWTLSALTAEMVAGLVATENSHLEMPSRTAA
ncbi:D-amino acid dehydrogenase [Bradyrhizobium sp. LVM 105]|uniref:D-amino acid dehydrogenase n=1 Tax=Bradyrhizobium sp. LVM 105 TaxID=2341115 RepID=UPI000F80D2B9|nr:D-amino acid dehydrogenase [Bradyrhizobium sp. LVM 105]RTE91368.1 D-amino acid dehydrogenase [Bradyrhizobium sp. LVM 105]